MSQGCHFVNRGYTKRIPFLSKMAYTPLDLGAESSGMKFCWVPPGGPNALFQDKLEHHIHANCFLVFLPVFCTFFRICSIASRHNIVVPTMGESKVYQTSKIGNYCSLFFFNLTSQRMHGRASKSHVSQLQINTLLLTHRTDKKSSTFLQPLSGINTKCTFTYPVSECFGFVTWF